MRRSSVSVVAVALLVLTSARAQLTYVYTDDAGDHLFGTASNWTPPNGEAVPPSHTAGTIIIRSQTGSQSLILPAGASTFDSLLIDNSDYNGTPFYFASDSASHVGFSNGIMPTSFRSGYGYASVVTFAPSVSVRLDADQTWSNTYTQAQGSISGAGHLTIDPASTNYGNVDFSGPNAFDGGLTIHDSYVGLHHGGALGGAGPLAFRNVSFNTDAAFDFDRSMTLGGSITFSSWETGADISITAPVVLDTSVSLSNYIDERGPILISGGLSESAAASLIVLNGSFAVGNIAGPPASTYTGNTVVQSGRLYFLNAEAVPTSGPLLTSTGGYIGAAFENNVQSAFVARVSPTDFKGTLGFDTAPEDSTITTINGLDLSPVDPGFQGLGSTTAARLDGTLTLGSLADYRFAGGGGTLFIGANLDQTSANLNLVSDEDPLKLVLQGTNSFGGNVYVSNGRLVLDSAQALPETATVYLGSDRVSYLGATENAPFTLAGLLGKLGSYGPESVIGFDSANPAAPRTLSEPLDLSLNGEVDFGYYFGTTSSLVVTGAITPAAIDGSLHFAAPGGRLQLDTSLGSGVAVSDVWIGTPGGDPQGVVALNSANAITGDFHLQSGVLELGHAQALGTSSLVVDDDYSSDQTLLTNTSLTISNPIQLFGDLDIGREDVAHNLKLTGRIEGPYYYGRSLDYRGAGDLELAGSGHLLSVYLHAPETGSVTLTGIYPESYFSVQSGTLNIGTGRRSIGAISTYEGTTTNLASGTTVSLDGSYWGEGGPYGYFEGTVAGAGGFLLASENSPSLHLFGANTFSGGVTAHTGQIEIGHDQALGSGALILRGDADLLIAHPELTLANTFDIEGRLRIEQSYDTDVSLLTLNGSIFGTGKIEFLTPTALNGSSLFDGQFIIGETTVDFLSDSSTGGAGLDFDGASEYGYSEFYGPAMVRFLSTQPTISGLDSQRSNTMVRLAPNTRLTIDQRFDDSLFFGSITGTGEESGLRKLGDGRLVLGGSVNVRQGLDIDEGAVIFATSTSLEGFGTPDSNRIRIGAEGYAGLGTMDVDIANFFGRIDAAATLGAVGFDTVNFYEAEYGDGYDIEPNVFDAPIDLSGFAAGVALASATEAVLGPNAVITPAGDANAPYRFGGSQGVLLVQSPLTGARDLLGQSRPDAPLLVALLGHNTFTGSVSAQHAGFTFAADALPSTTPLHLGTGGYLGTLSPSLSVAAFLNHFPVTTTEGIIGFDRWTTGDDDSSRILGEAIALDRFTGATLPYLGTASQLIVRGPIQLPAADSTLRLAGYRGGELFIETPLTGAAVSLQIGDPASLGTHGDPVFEELSTVALTGANTYGGGTELFSGRLEVAGSPATSGLGTGPLVVQPNHFVTLDPDLQPVLAPFDDAWITNAVTLNSSLTLESGDGRLKLAGNIDGVGALTVSDYSTIQLAGHNSYLGGTTLGEAVLITETSDALGAGGLDLDAHHATLIAQAPLELGGSLRFVGPANAHLDLLGHDLTVQGGIDLGGGNRSLNLGADLFVNGPVTGSGYVHLSGGRAWIADARLFTGRFNAYDAQLIFTGVSAIPNEIRQNGGMGTGYYGLAEVPESLADDFLSAFDPTAVETTIGFDTLPGQATNLFDTLIDLSEFLAFNSAFDDVAIGTASRAILSGTIIPSGDTFVFGGESRGWLDVTSDLGDGQGPRDLYLANDGSRAFVLRLSGANTYSGSTYISGGALIIGSADALPGGTQVEIDQSSYFGTGAADLSFASLLNHLPVSTVGGTLGVDTADPASPRVLTSPDLSRFTTTGLNIALGTATAAVIDGTIALPPAQTAYSFAAYGGGELTVAADLSGARSVEIGISNVPQTFRDTGLGLPSVALTGTNTYTGGTTWRGGRLALGNSSALGTGALTVASNNSYAFDSHVLAFGTGTIANDIDLQAGLKLESSVPHVTLSGNLSGYNTRLAIADDFTLHLTGNNSLNYGSFIIAGGSISFENADQAVGMQNGIVFSGQGGSAAFSSANPEIVSLHRDQGAAATVQLAAGTTLGITNYDDEHFDGTISGAGALEKNGFGRLALFGNNSYAGGTTIAGGILHAGNASALGTGAIVLDGGRLSLAPGVSLANSFSFGSGGGTLGGNGTFSGPVTLGAHSGLAPGESVGALTFTDNLTWAGGAFFEMEIENAFGLAGSGYDTIDVGGTLTVSATLADPFLIQLLTINDGESSFSTLEFDNTLHYTWTLASAATIVGFDPAAFSIDSSGFNTDVGALGNFFVSSDGTSLFVNFTPVPEPSTFALLGLGLGFIALHGWRRRRRQA